MWLTIRFDGQRYKDLLDDIFHRQVLAEDFSLYLDVQQPLIRRLLQRSR